MSASSSSQVQEKVAKLISEPDETRAKGTLTAELKQTKRIEAASLMIKHGCCMRCVLRFFNISSRSFYTLPDEAMATCFASAGVTPAPDIDKTCAVCVGILQHRTSQLITFIPVIEASGYSFASISVNVSLPPSVSVRHAAMWRFLKDTYGATNSLFAWRSNDSSVAIVDLKDAARWMLGECFGHYFKRPFITEAGFALTLEYVWDMDRDLTISTLEFVKPKRKTRKERMTGIHKPTLSFSLAGESKTEVDDTMGEGEEEEEEKGESKEGYDSVFPNLHGVMKTVEKQVKTEVSAKGNKRLRVELLSRDSVARALPYFKPENFKKFNYFPPPSPPLSLKSLSTSVTSFSQPNATVTSEETKYIVLHERSYLNVYVTPHAKPMFISGVKRGESSVEEEIIPHVEKFFKCSAAKFLPSGREDKDVRMLGDGRPFFFEIVNPKISRTDAELAELESIINNAYKTKNESTETKTTEMDTQEHEKSPTPLVSVIKLQNSTRTLYKKMVAQIETKKKKYRAVVRIDTSIPLPSHLFVSSSSFDSSPSPSLSSSVTTDTSSLSSSVTSPSPSLSLSTSSPSQTSSFGSSTPPPSQSSAHILSSSASTEKGPPSLSVLIAKLNEMKEIVIQQNTPLRVLHRRTLMTRPKTISSMVATLIDEQHFRLDMATDSGTYIKEFVHGDRGRTVPSVGMLQGYRCDILQLDVMGFM